MAPPDSSGVSRNRYEEKQRERFSVSQSKRHGSILKKTIGILAGVALIGSVGLLMSRKPSGEPKGETIPDLGRNHVPEGTVIEYNSNPPTSGSHYETWEKAGVYDRSLKDEKLVHSLEHGYIIMSYNCDIPRAMSFAPRAVYAHETDDPHEEPATESGAITTEERTENQSTESWKDDLDCQSLVTELERIAKKLRLWKLILVPRPNMENRIALTAWTKLDKFNEPDEDRIAAFVNAYRNKGPEKTME